VKPELSRGDAVTVREAGIEPWSGVVLSVKPHTPKRDVAWAVEVQRDDGCCWIVDSERVSRG